MSGRIIESMSTSVCESSDEMFPFLHRMVLFDVSILLRCKNDGLYVDAFIFIFIFFLAFTSRHALVQDHKRLRLRIFFLPHLPDRLRSFCTLKENG